ncbi:DUF3558 family protein [Saccharopolyspora sp. MS10]|uniref:DUF3558 family protein n=1 Tax=Saccharopolyspora sp. MS10 TaxID=3385973 RepID=UPI0039A31BDA
MSALSRCLAVAISGIALIGVSSCALGGAEDDAGSGDSNSGQDGLESFDPCTFFKPEELTSYGVSTQAEDFTLVSFQPGCSWDGDRMDVALQKNADETVESLSNGSYDEYTPIEVGGRDGARMIVSGAEGEGGCITVVPAGEGVVLYQLTAYMRDSVADPCAEIEEIADQTASRLPE